MRLALSTEPSANHADWPSHQQWWWVKQSMRHTRENLKMRSFIARIKSRENWQLKVTLDHSSGHIIKTKKETEHTFTHWALSTGTDSPAIKWDNHPALRSPQHFWEALRGQESIGRGEGLEALSLSLHPGERPQTPPPLFEPPQPSPTLLTCVH